MGNVAMPTFDEWVNYCLTQGYPDLRGDRRSRDYDAVDSRLERFLSLPPNLLAQYVIKLFRSPAFIADRYDDDQIASATSFLFGFESGYSYDWRSKAVPRDMQVECMSSVATLYTDLFDRVCCKRGTDPDGDYRNDLEVDGAVYMIWDMSGIEGAVMYSKKTPHLVDPGFDVLKTILTRCRTSSCQVSALHGLGHIHRFHRRRTEQMIDAFLKSRSVAGWVRKYARAARSGGVQ